MIYKEKDGTRFFLKGKHLVREQITQQYNMKEVCTFLEGMMGLIDLVTYINVVSKHSSGERYKVMELYRFLGLDIQLWYMKILCLFSEVGMDMKQWTIFFNIALVNFITYIIYSI